MAWVVKRAKLNSKKGVLWDTLMGILTQSFGSCCAAINILEFDDLRQLPDSVHLQFQNKVVFWMMLMLMRATWLEGRGRAGAKSFKRKVKWNFQKGLRLQHDDNSEGCGQPIPGGTGKEKLKTLVCDEKVFGAKGVVLTLYWCLLTLHWTASDLLCVWTTENSWEHSNAICCMDWIGRVTDH